MIALRTLMIAVCLAGCAAPPPASAPAVMPAPAPMAPMVRHQAPGHFPAVTLFNAWLNMSDGSPNGYSVYIYVLTNASVPTERRRALYSALTCTTLAEGVAQRTQPLRGVVLFPHRGRTRSLVTASALLNAGGYSDADANDLMAALEQANVLPSITREPIYLAIRHTPIERDAAGTVVYDLSRLSAPELQAWLLDELNTLRIGRETDDGATRRVTPHLIDTLNEVGYHAEGFAARLIPALLTADQPMLTCEGRGPV